MRRHSAANSSCRNLVKKFPDDPSNSQLTAQNPGDFVNFLKNFDNKKKYGESNIPIIAAAEAATKADKDQDLAMEQFKDNLDAMMKHMLQEELAEKAKVPIPP